MGLAVLFLLSNIVVATVNTDKIINGSKDIQLINKIFNFELSEGETIPSVLLSKFKKQPDDLELIKEITSNEQRLNEYIKQRIKGAIPQSELLLLIEALSLIDSEKSKDLMATIGLQFVSNLEVQYSLLVFFSELTETTNVSKYYDSIFMAGRKQNVNLLRAALLSVSMNKNPMVNRIAIKYRSPGISSDVRFIGLYMASMLGKDGILKKWILQTFYDGNRPPTYQYYYLLMALSRQMTDDEFNDFLSRSYVPKTIIDSVISERLFHQGNATLRLQMAPKLIKSNFSDQRNSAISFLLKEQGFEKTWQQLNQKQRLTAIRLSYKLNVPFELPNIDESFSINYLWYVFTLGVIGLLVFVGFRSKL